MRKTKVAFIASTLVVGGAENVLLNLLSHLPDEKFDTKAYFLRAPGPVGSRIAEMGIACEHGLQQHRADPTVLLRLVPRLKRFGPDILFSLDHHNAMFWGRLSSIAARVPRRVV
ncbi:MAG: hypothetical protein JSW58_08030, partial [Candidatus Latescibacterota bacterium]